MQVNLRRITGASPLSLYTGVRRLDGSACTYYRVATPFKTMSELGLATTTVDDHIDRSEDAEKERQANMAYSDLHLYYLNVDPTIWQRAAQFRKWKVERDHTMQYRKPPQVIFDTDDHVEFVDVFNPKFVTLGTRLPDGTKIKPGNRIHADLTDGTKMLIWEDKTQYPDGFSDWARNIKKMKGYRKIIRQVDACTTSSEVMAEVLRKNGARKLYVYPNSLRPEDYPIIPIQRSRRKVRILWQGGYSHFNDWHPLREAMGAVLRARPNAEFVCWGMLFPGVERECPKKQLKFINWCDYSKYTIRLATIGHHINLAPLVRNTFNDCKSPIKYMESAAIHVPAATLAADGPVYGPAIEVGVTGLLYDPEDPEDFKTKLIALIDDAALRQTLAKNAHEQVWDVWDAYKTTPGLYRFYQELRESR